MAAKWLQAPGERLTAWIARTRAPEPAPVILSRRRIYVLPTRAGLLFALTLFVLLLGAVNYNLSLGYGLVFLLSGLGVVSLLHCHRNLAGLRLTLAPPTPVHVGEIACFPLLLEHDDASERRRIRLSLPEQAAVFADPAPRASTRVLLPIRATRRGWLARPRVTLETVWPLGLFRAWSLATPAQACLVYPRPAAAVPPAPNSAGQQDGRLSSDIGAAGDEDFAGLRRHQPSDPPHHVAWKAAARLGPEAPLRTKQFAAMMTRTPWFDWATLPPTLDIEERLSILARWILDAEAAGQTYGLRLPGRELPPARGRVHLHACLKNLALHGQDDGAP